MDWQMSHDTKVHVLLDNWQRRAGQRDGARRDAGARVHRKSRFEARRDLSEWRSAAAHAPFEPFGKTETKLDYVLKHTSAEIIERRLQAKDLLWLREVHSPRPRLDSPAQHSSEWTNG